MLSTGTREFTPWDSLSVDDEPLRDEESVLLKILSTLAAEKQGPTAPPLWEHANFRYNSVSPHPSQLGHYCFVKADQFYFCASIFECKCPPEDSPYLKMSQRGSLLLANKMSKELRAQQKVVTTLSKQLKSNCDRIFDGSIPFVVDIYSLGKLLEAINSVFNNRDDNEYEDSKEYQLYMDLVMFLSDFCQQTPSLCISYSGGHKSDVHDPLGTVTQAVGSSAGNSPDAKEANKLDVSRFKSITSLELRHTSPTKLTGVAPLRIKIQRLKASRSIHSLSQLLLAWTNKNLPESTQIWPELQEIDMSYNKISHVTSEDVGLLEFCPSLTLLNLSRNKISEIDSRFSKTLSTLCVLNLSYNQLTMLPPIPPNVKTLLLSHNYIGTLLTPRNRSSGFLDVYPLRNVEVLDISANLISNETDLVPLKEMPQLKKLNLAGNPLSFIESYRRTVAGYLCRSVISRKFELDKKSLSSSEVRWAVDQCKKGNFIPFIPANTLLISQASSAMSTSIDSNSTSGTGSMQRSSTSQNLKSFIMTQSYDSSMSSSSMRSSRRKKPKIREIMTLDFPEDDQENASPSTSTSASYKSSDTADTTGGKYDSGVAEETKNTRDMVTKLRAKYGAEHWLKQGASCQMNKLLKIPERPTQLDNVLSRSLPDEKFDTGYSSSPRNSSMMFQDRSGPSHSPRNDNYFNTQSPLPIGVRRMTNQPDSRSPVTSPSDSTFSGTPQAVEGDELFSVFSNEEVEPPSIFDMSKAELVDETFVESDYSPNEFHTFRIFQAGLVFKLIIYDDYLMEVNPSDNTVLNKWDLKCLLALEEERCDSETESIEFRLKFDVMRKSMRGKSFIMGTKEFAIFDKLVNPYIEEKTLQEFTDALQCTKCYAQFSRGMAGRTVRHENGQAPVEIAICPDPQCGFHVLVTLDEIPLPNNEVLDLDTDGKLRGPLKASTPVSARGMSSKQTPFTSSSLKIHDTKSRSPRVFDFLNWLPSSLTKKGPTNDDIKVLNDETNKIATDRASDSVTPTSGATNTKSESDIEVISTDSSSIEVLGKHCPDSQSESDIDVEEAIEIPAIEKRKSKSKDNKMVPLSESTSSSSCADSIVTTYEKNLLPISQPLSSPSQMPVPSNASYTSTSTLTPRSFRSLKSSPIHHPAVVEQSCMPVRYDYVNFSKTDHRLQLWCEFLLFKNDERLLALTKCMVIADSSTSGTFLGIVVFSSKKIYIYRICGDEGDRPQEWLQKSNVCDISKFTKLDVLIGRHGVGVDFSGKYFALIFRDSERTSGFLEFFMSDICGELTTPPMVRDFSQTQKVMLSPTNPISYFGIMRFSVCDSADKAYSVSAILLTNEELMLITDLSWMAGRSEKVTTTHGRLLSTLRQVECMESDSTFVRLVFQLEEDKVLHWDLIFETENERCRFEECLKTDLNREDVAFICLSQPLES